MLVQLIDLALHGGVALILLGALSLVFVKAPRASITLVLVLAVLEGSREWPVPLGTSFGSINVSWADVATALMGGVAIGRLAWRRVASPARGALLGMTAMIGLGLVSWILILGLQPAVNFWRAWTFAVAAALYAASAPRLSQPDGLRPFVWAALLGSFTQVLGIALRGFGGYGDSVIVNGEVLGARPVTAAVALIMLMGMIVLLLDGRRVGAFKLLVTVWLGVSIIASQHRSVWVASAVTGVLIVFAIARTSRQRLVVGTLAAIGASTVAIAVAAVVRAQEQLSVAASSTGTLEWRIDNWTEKLTTERSALQWLAGSVFGPTPLSDPDADVLFQVSSHSMYVETIAKLGLLGLGLLTIVTAGAISTSRSGSAVRVAVITLLAHGLFYQWPGVTWLVIGVAATGRATTDQNARAGNRLGTAARHDSSRGAPPQPIGVAPGGGGHGRTVQ